MQNSSIDWLARFLVDLRGSFGAEILDARDDMDGSIVVDVRVDAGKALKHYRRRTRQQAAVTRDRSRELVDTAHDIFRRTDELLAVMEAKRTQLSGTLEARRETVAARSPRALLGQTAG